MPGAWKAGRLGTGHDLRSKSGGGLILTQLLSNFKTTLQCQVLGDLIAVAGYSRLHIIYFLQFITYHRLPFTYCLSLTIRLIDVILRLNNRILLLISYYSCAFMANRGRPGPGALGAPPCPWPRPVARPRRSWAPGPGWPRLAMSLEP